ncbi:surface carbohydrate biosynthesis protein [Salipaludibacillus neizhouensis]|uniref:surface carbohydrate biosynthesis protein n=1 Tax=Salipaludibacillus neizhouensis TaxID=885475 RepID=UPI000DA5F1BD|nr:surface carbohydrate biosynthesis protein [Salipaludibacillus neizhouensis]
MLKKQTKWIYIPIELPTREIDGKLLLAYFAVKNNYRVIIGEQRNIYDFARFFPPGIFLSKGYPNINKYKTSHLFNIKKQGHSIVELDEEGLFLNLFRDRTSNENLKILNQIYCWGDVQKKTLVNTYPHFKNRFSITGHPRFDLLREKYRSVHNHDVEQIKKKYGDFILVNTRFGFYNHISRIKGIMKRRNKDLYDDSKTLYHHFIKMVKGLSKSYPNFNIVIRPHPSESKVEYQREFMDYNNVFIEHAGTVAKWILASKLMIHNNCTTGVEAFLLNKPVISYMPIKPKLNVYLANAVSYKATNLVEVTTFIDSYISTGKINNIIDDLKYTEKGKKILSNHYGAMDGSYAYEKIIRELNKIKINRSSALRTKAIKEKRVKRSKLVVTEAKIKSFFNKLDRIESVDNKLTVRRLKPNLLYLIEPNEIKIKSSAPLRTKAIKKKRRKSAPLRSKAIKKKRRKSAPLRSKAIKKKRRKSAPLRTKAIKKKRRKSAPLRTKAIKKKRRKSAPLQTKAIKKKRG